MYPIVLKKANENNYKNGNISIDFDEGDLYTIKYNPETFNFKKEKYEDYFVIEKDKISEEIDLKIFDFFEDSFEDFLMFGFMDPFNMRRKRSIYLMKLFFNIYQEGDEIIMEFFGKERILQNAKILEDKIQILTKRFEKSMKKITKECVQTTMENKFKGNYDDLLAEKYYNYKFIGENKNLFLK